MVPFFAKPAPTNPRHVLRGILRLARTPVLPKELQRKGQSGPPLENTTRSFVLEQYRQHRRPIQMMQPPQSSRPMPDETGGDGTADDRSSTSGSAEEISPLLESLATNYHQLQLDLAERGRLYRLDAGADVVLTPHELSRRAAARAGLQLPKIQAPQDDKDADAEEAVEDGGGVGVRPRES